MRTFPQWKMQMMTIFSLLFPPSKIANLGEEKPRSYHWLEEAGRGISWEMFPGYIHTGQRLLALPVMEMIIMMMMITTMMMISKLQTYWPASASTTWDENNHDDIVDTGNDIVGGGGDYGGVVIVVVVIVCKDNKSATAWLHYLHWILNVHHCHDNQADSCRFPPIERFFCLQKLCVWAEMPPG